MRISRCLLFMVLCAVLSTVRAQDGVPVNGFPKWEERVLHEWVNRARCDPQFEMTACGAACSEFACYTPKPPLIWDLNLARAARFHSDEMQARSFFSHDSNCTLVSNISALYPASCTGAASCACMGGTATCSPTCTTFPNRVSLFGVASSGENMASTSNPNTAFYLWLYENNAPNTTCAFTVPNGHRWLILMATGKFGAGTSIYSTIEFGSGGTIPKIPSGSHYPKQASSVDVWTNWYDTAGPSQAVVNIDGVNTALTLRRGTAQNGAWSATITGVGTGCHRYYFAFRDAGGATHTYPASGSLGIGGAGCADWDTSRAGSGEVPDASRVPGVPLRISKAGGGQLALTWGPSCSLTDNDYEVYEGALGSFTTHAPVSCSTAGATSATVTPPAGSSRYYLVVPTNGSVEGSYGTDRAGTPRAAGSSACRIQIPSPCS